MIWVHSLKLLHQNQGVSVQHHFHTLRPMESFHGVTEAVQPRLFPSLLICLGTHRKVKANQLKVGSITHKLQHANPFHRCSHLGVKWFKVIEIPCHWDLFTFPVGGCGLMLQNRQQWYQLKRNFPSYKKNNKHPQKIQSKIWSKLFLTDFAIRSVCQTNSQLSHTNSMLEALLFLLIKFFLENLRVYVHVLLLEVKGSSIVVNLVQFCPTY